MTAREAPSLLLTGAARLAAVIGWPIAHSRSPRLHGYWFARYGIDGVLVPLAVAPADLPLAFQALPRLGLRGWNVTVPHKEAAFALVDERDDAAAAMGAVNTVLVRSDGRTRGLNTDGAGFAASLRSQAPRWRPEAGPAAILGAGGAARAVAATLLQMGVPALRLSNRSAERAAALADELRRHHHQPVETVPWGSRGSALREAALLVNATSLGMTGQPPLDLDLAPLPGDATVADLVYVPLATPLLRAAGARGLATVDGLGMLIHQAVPGFAHWGGIVPEVDAATRACLLEGLA